MITRKAAPALAAGCSFIEQACKPGALSAYAIAERLIRPVCQEMYCRWLLIIRQLSWVKCSAKVIS